MGLKVKFKCKLNKLCFIILLTSYCSFSVPHSLSPLQERQFIPLLRLLLRLYLSVWSSRASKYWHHWLGNMVSIVYT